MEIVTQVSEKTRLHSVTSHTVKARSINSPILPTRTKRSQTRCPSISQGQRWTGVEGSQADAALRTVGNHGVPLSSECPWSWGSDSPLYPNIRSYLSRQGLVACWALVLQILDGGFSLPRSRPRFEHHLSLIMPGYMSPAHTSLLKPECAPHLPAWRLTM